MITRRGWVFAAIASSAGLAMRDGFGKTSAAGPNWTSFEASVKQTEEASCGRLGVAVLDTATGVRIGHRAQERFPMCSTFKLLLVGAVLKRADREEEQMDRVIRFTQKDLVAYSPATEKRVGSIGMSVKELCAAAMKLSDNTAANLLLASVAGPAGVNAFLRALGDDITRLDRMEPDLNEALPGDPRDTSTPEQMVSNLYQLALGDTLSEASRVQLTEWLIQNQTGDKRLRAGLPAGWKVGDKTGSGERGTTNDVAIVWPPNHAAVLVAAYLTGSAGDEQHRNSTIAAVGTEVAAAFP